jgi:hypothetical protein
MEAHTPSQRSAERTRLRSGGCWDRPRGRGICDNRPVPRAGRPEQAVGRGLRGWITSAISRSRPGGDVLVADEFPSICVRRRAPRSNPWGVRGGRLTDLVGLSFFESTTASSVSARSIRSVFGAARPDRAAGRGEEERIRTVPVGHDPTGTNRP